MADTDGAASLADAAPDLSQADTTTTQAAGVTDDKTPSAAEFRKVQNEAKNLRARLKNIEDAGLSETEKLKQELQQAQIERDTQTATLRTLQAERAASDAGAIYPDLMAEKIPTDALGDKTQLTRALDDLRKTYPTLFRSVHGNGDGAGGRQQPATDDMNSLIRRRAGLS